MNVVVVIDGKDAIPVRAIPYLTNFETISLDAIAMVFAKDKFFDAYREMVAYIKEGASVRVIEATWWENVACRQFKALSDLIGAEGITHETGLQEWRIKSLDVIPAGTFVWKDEFVLLHDQMYGRYGIRFLNSDGQFLPRDEQFTRTKLNFSPFVPDIDIQKKLLDGFEIIDSLTVVDTPKDRRLRYLTKFTEEEKRMKRGALQRTAEFFGIDQSNLSKEIKKIKEFLDAERKAGSISSQFIKDGKRQ